MVAAFGAASGATAASRWRLAQYKKTAQEMSTKTAPAAAPAVSETLAVPPAVGMLPPAPGYGCTDAATCAPASGELARAPWTTEANVVPPTSFALRVAASLLLA